MVLNNKKNLSLPMGSYFFTIVCSVYPQNKPNLRLEGRLSNCFSLGFAVTLKPSWESHFHRQDIFWHLALVIGLFECGSTALKVVQPISR